MRRIAFGTVPYVLCALPVLAGCSAQLSASADGADAESASVTGVVIVERTVSGEDAPRSDVSARFVRVREGAEDEALRLVGANLDLPVLGTCAPTQVAAEAAPKTVRLMDVGAVSIEADGQTTPLLARRVPDVVDLISGSVYSARTDVAGETAITVRVGGGNDVAPFAVSGDAPDAVSGLQISGLDPSGEVPLPAATPVDLTWDAGTDLIYVDVSGATGITRCAFGDDGHAVLPSSVLQDDRGTLVVHRVRSQDAQAAGLAGVELRFDFARAVAYRRL